MTFRMDTATKKELPSGGSVLLMGGFQLMSFKLKVHGVNCFTIAINGCHVSRSGRLEVY